MCQFRTEQTLPPRESSTAIPVGEIISEFQAVATWSGEHRNCSRRRRLQKDNHMNAAIASFTRGDLIWSVVTNRPVSCWRSEAILRPLRLLGARLLRRLRLLAMTETNLAEICF